MATIRRDHTGKKNKGITPPLSAGNTPLRITPTNLYTSKTNNYLIAQYHQYSQSSPKRPNYLRSTDVSKLLGERKPPANDNVAPKSTSTRRKSSDKTPIMPAVLTPRLPCNASVSCPSPSSGRTNVGPHKPVTPTPEVQKPVPQTTAVQKSVPKKPVVQKTAPKRVVPTKNVPSKISRAPIKDPLKQRSSSFIKPSSTVSSIKKKQETRKSTSSVRKEKITAIASDKKVENCKRASIVPEQVTQPRAQETSVVECNDHVRQPQYQESSIVEGGDRDHQTEQVLTKDGKGTDDHETEQVVIENGKGAPDHETKQVVSESEKGTNDQQIKQVVSKSEKGIDDHQKEQVESNNEKGSDDLVVENEGSTSIGEKEMETNDADAKIVIPEDSTVLEEPSPIICVKTEERPTFVTSEDSRVLEEPSPIIAVKTEERPAFEEASKAREIEELYVNKVNQSIASEVKRITCASVEKDNPPIEGTKKQEKTELNNTGIEAQETKEIKGQQLAEEKKYKTHNIAAAQEKKGSTISNSVIEETANKLHEQRKNRVKALAGAFETVISKQEK